MTQLSENAVAIYKRLYLSKILGETTPTEAHRRVAKFAASAETTNEDKKMYESLFFAMMEENQFRPNTPTFMNAGIQSKPQTSACFVGDLQDDMLSILDFDRDAAIIYKSGSGIGGNYGLLREKNAALSTGGFSSGPAAFLRKLAATAHAVRSGGQSRRAAHMAMITDNHPDVLEFIRIKAESKEFVILPSGEKSPLFSAMNISIAATDAFMKAVENDEDWNLVGVVDGEIKSTMKARALFNEITVYAWRNGDPGLWFIDRANRDNTVPSIGRMLCTNPCGEQSLLPRQACGLGSINVAAFVHDGRFDWNAFEYVTSLAVRLLDNCIDLSGFPTPDYEKMAKLTRPIGLGIMGFADALIIMGLKYGSDEAVEFSRTLSKALTHNAIMASAILAQEKGPFPLFEENRQAIATVASRHIDKAALITKIGTQGVRNSQWTTIAPTGTTSISCDCSQGMEPLFAICYDKHLSDSKEILTFVNPVFERRFGKCSWYPEVIKKIAANHGSLQGLGGLPDEAYTFVCAHDIPWRERIEMQSALQTGISNSISSTVNLPNSATPEEIGEIYMTAWKKGLKGITVYRDGCLESQPVHFGTTASAEPTRPVPAARPKIRHGFTHEVNTGHGKIYLTINCNLEGQPMEIFTNGGKNGSVNAANLEAMARLVSIALQEGVPAERLARTIENINDGTVAWDRLDEKDEKPVCIISIPDAIGKVLNRFYCQSQQPALQTKSQANTVRRCEKCNSITYMMEGCEFCPNCGSKCG